MGSNKLYRYPDEYIEVYDIINLERYSTPKNQGRNPPILVGKPKNFAKKGVLNKNLQLFF